MLQGEILTPEIALSIIQAEFTFKFTDESQITHIIPDLSEPDIYAVRAVDNSKTVLEFLFMPIEFYMPAHMYPYGLVPEEIKFSEDTFK